MYVLIYWEKNTDSLKCSSSRNNPSPPLAPAIPPPAPSSSPVNIRGLADGRMREQRSRAVTERSTVLHPGEEKNRTSYHMLHFLFLLLPEEYAEGSPLLYS